MRGLEKKVRGYLVEQRADDMIRYVSSNSERYRSFLTEIGEAMTDSMLDSMAAVFGSVEKDEKQEMMRGLRDEIQSALSSPEQLRRTMYESAKRQYMSLRELRARLKSHLEYLRGDIGDDVSKEYAKAHEGLFAFIRTNDEIVRRLTRIAEADGLEKATQKETMYAVVREMFPTVEEYGEYAKRGSEAVKKYFSEVQSALIADGEAGKLLAGMFGGIGNSLGRVEEIVQRLGEDYLSKRIAEIYG